MNRNDMIKRWTKDASNLLVGKKIVAVRYLTDAERDGLFWHSASLAIQLDDGTLIWPSSDDEGNDAGALFTTSEKLDTIPVI